MSYLSECSDQEALRVLAVAKQVKEKKSRYWSGNRGWTVDRERSMRHVASIPISFLFHPEFKKYFDPQATPEERKKDMDKFLRMFPEFDMRRL